MMGGWCETPSGADASGSLEAMVCGEFATGWRGRHVVFLSGLEGLLLMIRIGLVGIGFMGYTHFTAAAKLKGFQTRMLEVRVFLPLSCLFSPPLSRLLLSGSAQPQGQLQGLYIVAFCSFLIL